MENLLILTAILVVVAIVGIVILSNSNGYSQLYYDEDWDIYI